jgi:hypothetical protein
MFVVIRTCNPKSIKRRIKMLKQHIKNLNSSLLTLFFLGLLTFALAGITIEKTTKPIEQSQVKGFDAPLTYDTTLMWRPPGSGGIMWDVVAGSKIKGATDDTVRIFTSQYTPQHYTMLLTDTGTSSMKWRADTLDRSSGTYEYRGVAIGDLRRQNQNDLF